jgi:GT2 family glycosyltransferase
MAAQQLMANDIAIVILNYKNWQDTVECLDSVMKITYQNYRVIVVDNDSQNDSIAQIGVWLKQHSQEYLLRTQEESENGEFIDHPLVLIQSASNRGYAAGNNVGIRWAIRAGDEYILILNNDTMVERNFLEPLIGFLDTHPTTAIVGPLLKGPEGNIHYTSARKQPTFWDYFFRFGFGKTFWLNNPWCRSEWYFKNKDTSFPFEIEVFSGSCALIRADFLKTIGLLDENTFLFAEEYILSEQAKCSQKNIYLIPASSVIHKHGQSISQRPSLAMQQRALESHSHYLRHYRHFSANRTFLYLLSPYIVFFKIKIHEYLKALLGKGH